MEHVHDPEFGLELLAADAVDVTYPCDLIGPLVYAEDVLAEPVEYVDGSLFPRERPGFGIELRES